MPFDVIMPALGMAQETGILVRWLKEPGDAVTKGEPLIEVETDKAVQEIEAQASGFLSALSAQAGDEVPVGQVIGLIVESADAVTGGAAAARAAVAEAEAAVVERVAEPEAEPVTAAAAPAPAPHPVAEPIPVGRLFASPKLRRVAAEEGLDLFLLARAGYAQPWHMADLDALRALAAANAAAPDQIGTAKSQQSAPLGQTSALGHVAARVSGAPCAEFLDWMAVEGKIALPASALYASFAAAALRAAMPQDRIIVGLVSLTDEGLSALRLLADPDHARLSHQPGTDAAATLILRDLTDSPLTALRPLASDPVPVLTIARDGGDLRVSLDYPAGTLDDAAALSIISGLATRLAEPLAHLV